VLQYSLLLSFMIVPRALTYLTGTVPSSSRDGQFQRSRSGLRITKLELSYGGGQSSGNVELWYTAVFIMITILNI